MIAFKSKAPAYDTHSVLNLARQVQEWNIQKDTSTQVLVEARDPYGIASKSKDIMYSGRYGTQELRVQERQISFSAPAHGKQTALETIFTLSVIEDGKEIYTTALEQPALKKLFAEAKRKGSRIHSARQEVA